MMPVAKVMMNGGMRSNAMPKPLAAPMSPVVAKTAGVPQNRASGEIASQPNKRTPPRLITGPIDRSSPPIKMTICWPNATAITIAESTRMASASFQPPNAGLIAREPTISAALMAKRASALESSPSSFRPTRRECKAEDSDPNSGNACAFFSEAGVICYRSVTARRTLRS
jgi:hypothetical protein